MKRLFSILCLLFVAFLPQDSVAKKAKAFFSMGTFNTPDNKPYVETYLTFVTNSLQLKKNQNGLLNAEVNVSVFFIQNGEKVNGMTYQLSSPEFKDSANTYNFIDQQRFELPNGRYQVELSIKDAFSTEDKGFTAVDSLVVDFNPSQIQISTVQLLESYQKAEKPGVLTKSGYDLIPYVANFYPEGMNKLIYYAEIYGSDKTSQVGDAFVLLAYIESFETETKIAGFHTFSKQTAKPVLISFNEFSIAELPSGNYYLVVELKDKNNQSIAIRKAFFQRSNPKFQLKMEDLATVNTENSFVLAYQHADTLREYIRSLRPISNQMEVTFAQNSLKSADLETMQKFFHNFWKNRDKINTEQTWLAYNEKVKLVNKKYGTSIRKGYMTDRGRVYLKYGEPQQVSRFDNEPSAYPYEIWQYYKMDQRNNRRFVFYNPDLVTNDYVLLHSDAIGETRDDRWRVRLTKRNNAINNFDKENSVDHFGTKMDDFYSNPR